MKRDGLVERLAERAQEAWDFNRAGAEHQAVWWTAEFAQVLEEEAARYLHVTWHAPAARWLRSHLPTNSEQDDA